MVCIYCIEDINDLKYVGSTKQPLNSRLSQHQCDLRRATKSSSKLNLYNCIIYELESCPENERKERERYWINKIDCVNEKKLNGTDIERKRKRMKEYCKRPEVREQMRKNNLNYYYRKKTII